MAYAHARFDDLDPQGHSGSAEAKSQYWIISTTKQAINIYLARQLVHDLDFENIFMAWPSFFFLFYRTEALSKDFTSPIFSF